MKPPRTPGVYAVRGIPGWIKIGKANDIARRIADLQMASPVQLQLLAVLSTNVRDELIFHRHLDHLRGIGEWFREDAELLLFVAARRANPHSCPHASLRLATRTAAEDPARRASAREPEGAVYLNELADSMHREQAEAIRRFTAGVPAHAGATTVADSGEHQRHSADDAAGNS